MAPKFRATTSSCFRSTLLPQICSIKRQLSIQAVDSIAMPRAPSIDSPTKARISRRFQELGGSYSLALRHRRPVSSCFVDLLLLCESSNTTSRSQLATRLSTKSSTPPSGKPPNLKSRRSERHREAALVEVCKQAEEGSTRENPPGVRDAHGLRP